MVPWPLTMEGFPVFSPVPFLSVLLWIHSFPCFVEVTWAVARRMRWNAQQYMLCLYVLDQWCYRNTALLASEMRWQSLVSHRWFTNLNSSLEVDHAVERKWHFCTGACMWGVCMPYLSFPLTTPVTSSLAVCSGTFTVQLQKDEKHVNTRVKQKPFMTT